jgi:hypothetical protein
MYQYFTAFYRSSARRAADGRDAAARTPRATTAPPQAATTTEP